MSDDSDCPEPDEWDAQDEEENYHGMIEENNDDINNDNNTSSQNNDDNDNFKDRSQDNIGQPFYFGENQQKLLILLLEKGYSIDDQNLELYFLNKDITTQKIRNLLEADDMYLDHVKDNSVAFTKREKRIWESIARKMQVKYKHFKEQGDDDKTARSKATAACDNPWFIRIVHNLAIESLDENLDYLIPQHISSDDDDDAENDDDNNNTDNKDNNNNTNRNKTDSSKDENENDNDSDDSWESLFGGKHKPQERAVDGSHNGESRGRRRQKRKYGSGQDSDKNSNYNTTVNGIRNNPNLVTTGDTDWKAERENKENSNSHRSNSNCNDNSNKKNSNNEMNIDIVSKFSKTEKEIFWIIGKGAGFHPLIISKVLKTKTAREVEQFYREIQKSMRARIKIAEMNSSRPNLTDAQCKQLFEKLTVRLNTLGHSISDPHVSSAEAALLPQYSDQNKQKECKQKTESKAQVGQDNKKADGGAVSIAIDNNEGNISQVIASNNFHDAYGTFNTK